MSNEGNPALLFIVIPEILSQFKLRILDLFVNIGKFHAKLVLLTWCL